MKSSFSSCQTGWAYGKVVGNYAKIRSGWKRLHTLIFATNLQQIRLSGHNAPVFRKVMFDFAK